MPKHIVGLPRVCTFLYLIACLAQILDCTWPRVLLHQAWPITCAVILLVYVPLVWQNGCDVTGSMISDRVGVRYYFLLLRFQHDASLRRHF